MVESELDELARLLNSGKIKVDELASLPDIGNINISFPTEPYLSCYIAEWQDLYGTLCCCCDMSHCINSDSDELL